MSDNAGTVTFGCGLVLLLIAISGAAVGGFLFIVITMVRWALS